MKTQVEKLPHSRVALTIEVDPNRVEQALDRAYRKVVRSLDIPGFRRGRAPRALVEMRFGREALLHEALEYLLPEVYSEAIKENDLQPVGEPTFDILEAEKGKPLRLEAQVDVKPPVELGPYRGLKGERVIRRITDRDVDDVLAAYQQRFARLEVVDRDVLEKGDFAVIDWDGFVDGKPFQGGAGRGHVLEVGAEAFLPGFDEQLVGRRLGKTFEVRLTFPDSDEYRDDLRGREVTFNVTLKEIKVKHVPPIDDELAKDAGEADTLAEWRQMIRERLEEQARDDAEDRLRDDLLRQVVDASEMELPQALVNGELEELLMDFERALNRQGVSLDHYLRHEGIDLDALRERFRPRAERRVRSRLVIDAIAEKENVTVSDEEAEAEARKRFGPMLERSEQTENPDAQPRTLPRDLIVSMANVLLVRKVTDLLVAEAQVEERWVDSLETEGEPGEAAAEGSPEDE